MCQLKIIRQKFPKSRFGELFNPTLLNFSFWLATAAFWFFAHQSLLPSSKEAGMVMIFKEITAYIFLAFGWLCTGCIGYLFISWVFNFKIVRGKSNEERIANLAEKLTVFTKECRDIRRELKGLKETDGKNGEHK